MKKMLLATALALLITGCAQQTFTVQNKPAAVAPKETITHHLLLEFRRKPSTAKICKAQKMLLKQKPAKHSNGLLGFITLGIIIRWKRVCIAHNNCMSCPSIWATLVCTSINIL